MPTTNPAPTQSAESAFRALAARNVSPAPWRIYTDDMSWLRDTHTVECWARHLDWRIEALASHESGLRAMADDDAAEIIGDLDAMRSARAALEAL